MIDDFNMSIKYIESDVSSNSSSPDQHVHEDCEIYIHLDGDVSFMVEDKIYPIRHGDILITRPYEYHHCIYHSKSSHKHFWILFSASGNEKIFKRFFDRKKGEGNLLSLNSENRQTLIDVCFRLCKKPESESELYCLFFTLINLIEGAKCGENGKDDTSTMSRILKSIHQNYADKLLISRLAEESYISVSTLERKFEHYFNITPYEYIKNIRLTNVARMLDEGKSVTESAEACGFSDTSTMITFFKKHFGMTPLQYKKRDSAPK
jgi:AraC-like DNA-binding protein